MDKKVISLLKTQCFIDGQWVGKPEISVTNKATGEEIAKVPRLGTKETKQAIDAAAKAFVTWSRLLAKERSVILRRWFDLQIQHADELALLLTSEQGKPLAEAKGEILYGAAFTEFYVGRLELDRSAPHRGDPGEDFHAGRHRDDQCRAHEIGARVNVDAG